MVKSLADVENSDFWRDRPVPPRFTPELIDNSTGRPKSMRGSNMLNLQNMPSEDELKEWRKLAGMSPNDMDVAVGGEDENDMYFGGYDAEVEEGGDDEV
jgi:hypothetical protein